MQDLLNNHDDVSKRQVQGSLVTKNNLVFRNSQTRYNLYRSLN